MDHNDLYFNDPAIDWKAVGCRLMLTMKREKITTRKLSDMTEIQYGEIANILDGNGKFIKQNVYAKLCFALDIDALYLLYEKQPDLYCYDDIDDLTGTKNKYASSTALSDIFTCLNILNHIDLITLQTKVADLIQCKKLTIANAHGTKKFSNKVKTDEDALSDFLNSVADDIEDLAGDDGIIPFDPPIDQDDNDEE